MNFKGRYIYKKDWNKLLINVLVLLDYTFKEWEFIQLNEYMINDINIKQPNNIENHILS